MNTISLEPAPHRGVSSGETRRQAIARAALEILGMHGSRGLTHRAIDKYLDLPIGTTSAYFRRREDLVAAAVQRLFASEFEYFDSTIGEFLSGNRAITLEEVAHFFAETIRGVRLNTSETMKLARYEVFLLARRDRAANRLMQDMFDERHRRDAQLLARLGAKDPEAAAFRLGFTLRGAFMSLTFLPEPESRLDMLDDAFFMDVIERIIGKDVSSNGQ
jgi:DNA-binding transcriptional regulator YbjK